MTRIASWAFGGFGKSDVPGLLPDLQFYKDVGNRTVEGLLDPDFWKGLSKEATIGLLGLPGDLGYLAGGVAPAVIDNWNEGRPLGTNLGDPRDYALTTDAIAEKLGVGFTDSGAEMAGRVLGGAVDIGMLPGLLNRIGKLVPDQSTVGGVPSGSPLAKQRGGPWIEGEPNTNILKFHPERGGDPVDVIRNPTKAELKEMQEIDQADSKFPAELRWVEDPDTGDIYGASGYTMLHEDIARAAGLDPDTVRRGVSKGSDFEWYGRERNSHSLDDIVLGRRQEWPDKPAGATVDPFE